LTVSLFIFGHFHNFLIDFLTFLFHEQFNFWHFCTSPIKKFPDILTISDNFMYNSKFSTRNFRVTFSSCISVTNFCGHHFQRHRFCVTKTTILYQKDQNEVSWLLNLDCQAKSGSPAPFRICLVKNHNRIY